MSATANVVSSTVEASARIKALADDPEQPISAEALVLVFIDTVRSENSGTRPATREDIAAANSGRQKFVPLISKAGPMGAAAGCLAGLYSEAAILCDVADASGLEVSREEMGAHVLVLWGVLPDYARALAATQGEEGKSVANYLKGRAAVGTASDNPDRMSKREVIGLVWRLRAGRKTKIRGAKSAVEDMITAAEHELGRALPRAKRGRRFGRLGAAVTRGGLR